MKKWVPFASKLGELSDFIQQKADSQKARWGLYFYSALESIIIPIPTDPLLATCVYAAPKRWWQLAIWTAIYSVIGGLVGWSIGWFMGDFVSFILTNDTIPFLTAEKFATVSAEFTQHGLLIVLLGAFTPLPFKLVTVTAGLFQFSIFPFLIASMFGRVVRFLLVAGLIRYHRDPKILVLISCLIGIALTLSYIIIGR
ncbi:MAG: DedA family protein [Alphaproteobacteria bacterium]|nr:DedA family protein [Alphaproteobacteria bacterium]